VDRKSPSGPPQFAVPLVVPNYKLEVGLWSLADAASGCCRVRFRRAKRTRLPSARAATNDAVDGATLRHRSAIVVISFTCIDANAVPLWAVRTPVADRGCTENQPEFSNCRISKFNGF
jgi:hypothetical protein